MERVGSIATRAMHTQITREVNEALFNELFFYRALRRTKPSQRLAKQRKKLCDVLRQVARSQDLALIISIETTLLKGDLENYANSKAMQKSLTAALNEMQAVVLHLALVADTEKYRFVNETHNIAKTRQGDIPLDDARLALAAHRTRLDNLDKSRLDEEEKELLEIRRDYMHESIGLYIELQKKSLGEAEP